MKPNLLLDHYLKALRLPTFLSEYKKVSRIGSQENLSYDAFLERLSALEVSQRESRAVARRLHRAGFPVAKDLSEFDFSSVPQVNKKRLLELFQCHFMEKKESILWIGPPGVGKTHLAIALGREACRKGKKVRFFTAAGLVNTYIEAREQREVRRLEAHIRQCDLIIVDELGYIPFSRTGSEHLFGFFSQCYEQVSLIVTTNLPFKEWPQIFGGDERLTGALLDRLTHRVHIIEIQGDSYRLRKSLERQEEGEPSTLA